MDCVAKIVSCWEESNRQKQFSLIYCTLTQYRPQTVFSSLNLLKNHTSCKNYLVGCILDFECSRNQRKASEFFLGKLIL